MSSHGDPWESHLLPHRWWWRERCRPKAGCLSPALHSWRKHSATNLKAFNSVQNREEEIAALTRQLVEVRQQATYAMAPAGAAAMGLQAGGSAASWGSSTPSFPQSSYRRGAGGVSRGSDDGRPNRFTGAAPGFGSGMYERFSLKFVWKHFTSPGGGGGDFLRFCKLRSFSGFSCRVILVVWQMMWNFLHLFGMSARLVSCVLTGLPVANTLHLACPLPPHTTFPTRHSHRPNLPQLKTCCVGTNDYLSVWIESYTVGIESTTPEVVSFQQGLLRSLQSFLFVNLCPNFAVSWYVFRCEAAGGAVYGLLGI